MIIRGRRGRTRIVGTSIVLLCCILLSPAASDASSKTAVAVPSSSSSPHHDEDGILNSYAAYRAYMRGGIEYHDDDDRDRHRRDADGGPARRTSEDDEAVDGNSYVAMPSHDHDENGENDGRRRVGHRRDQIRLVPSDGSSSKSSMKSSTTCSCSPIVYHLKLDLSGNCDTNDIKANGGIRGTLCLLGESSQDVSVDPILPDDDGCDGGGGPCEVPLPSVVPAPSGESLAPTYLPHDDVNETETPTYLVPFDTVAPTPSIALGGGVTTIPPNAMPPPSTYPPNAVTNPPVMASSGTTPIPIVGAMTTSAPTSASTSIGTSAISTIYAGGTSAPTPIGDGGGGGLGAAATTTYFPTPSETSSTYRPTYNPTGDGAVVDPFAPPAGTALIDAAIDGGNGGGGDDDVPPPTTPSKRERKKMMRTATLSMADTTNVREKPTAYPTFATPFPTDDATYPPTFVVAEYDGGGLWKGGSSRTYAFPASWAARPTAEPSTSGGAIIEGSAGDMRLLESRGSSFSSTSSGFDGWTSVHPNDEFFVRFPEFRSRQVEIYRLRNPGGIVRGLDRGTDSRATVGNGNRPPRHRDLMRDAGPPTDRQGDDGGMTIADIASANDDFSILLSAATAAGFRDILAGSEPMTVFAPTNAAFEALPDGMLDMLLLPENVSILQDVLKYHIISGAIASADFRSGDYVTLQGGAVNVETSDAGIKVDYAQVLYPDISASNGIVHVIDSVLLPPMEDEETTDVSGGDEVSDVATSTTVATDIPGDDGATVVVDPGSVDRIVSAQFLEMDTSPDMNIINQDDTYILISQADTGDDGKDMTLSYTSVSANLDPDVALDDQLGLLPGGVILILVGRTTSGEIVRNRLMWTYTIGCGTDDVTVEAGEGLGWAIFDKLEPAREEFCPASSPTPSPELSKPSGPSSKSGKPHKPASSSGSSDSAFSMPHDGRLLEKFDFDSHAKVAGKMGKSQRRRIEQRNHERYHKRKQQRSSSQQIENDNTTEEITLNVFGRRISRQKEARSSGKSLGKSPRTRSVSLDS
ncbi:hypothetical protein ACHAXA_009870 [Cyclostephanos tholiformis]|uniref:FAS1 domain-containing protein n=1 Tax=Cyclostephanos tholiformis TaxID=382380 RepID=A0ABD3RDJ4_9STRA